MRKQQDVTQFIVVPPLAKRQTVLERQKELLDYLGRVFPRFSFDITPLAPVSDEEDFIVFPIMNFVTPDGDSYMCRPLDPWIRSDIMQALRAFTPASLRCLN